MDTSFLYFWEGIFQNPMLLISALFTLGVIFVNGWTDAPNAIATCVTTRCLRPRQAIMMSAVFNFLGVFVMTQINSSVASTISNMVDFGDNTQSALIALCGGIIFRNTDQRESQPDCRSYRRCYRNSGRRGRCQWCRMG